MTMFSGPLSSQVLRFVCALAVAIGVSSCKTPGSAGSAYASSDGGGYNPYPGSGATQNGSLLASGSQSKYAEAPPPPPPGFDAPSEHFQSAPSRRSSSGSTKSKSGGVSSSKKKGSSSSSGGTTKGGYAFSGGSVHTVRAGDTLYAIADHNHTTVAKLKALNHLKSGVLKVGQKIKVK